jgi:uncharacterized protein YjaG (DUF416 family)
MNRFFFLLLCMFLGISTFAQEAEKQPSIISEPEIVQFVERFPTLQAAIQGKYGYTRYNDKVREVMLDENDFDQTLFSMNYNKHNFLDQVTRIRYAFSALLELEKIEEVQEECLKNIEKIQANKKYSDEEKAALIAQQQEVLDNLKPTLVNCSEDDIKVVRKYRNDLRALIEAHDFVKPAAPKISKAKKAKD